MPTIVSLGGVVSIEAVAVVTARRSYSIVHTSIAADAFCCGLCCSCRGQDRADDVRPGVILVVWVV